MPIISGKTLGKCLHAFAASIACYYLCLELIALTALLCKAFGMVRADAIMLAVMLGFGYLWALLIMVFSRARRIDAWLSIAVIGSSALVAQRVLMSG